MKLKVEQILFNEKVNGLNVVVRYPNRGDAVSMLDYINTLSKEKTYITYQGEQLTLEEEKKYLKSQLEKIKSGRTVHLMLFVDGNEAGISSIDLGKGIKGHIGVFGISIAKKYRGMGLGKLLMKLVFEESVKKLKDLKIIVLEVFGPNEKAIEMYKKFGFVESGRLPGGILYKGEYVDDIQMYMKVK